MSKMKDIYTELVDGIREIEDKQDEMGESLSKINERLDSLLHLMKDIVLLESKIEIMEKEIGGRLDKMEASQVDSSKLVDRLIEMAMINRGQAVEAVTHRAQARLENDFSNKQSWEDEPDEEVWPPPNCDVLDNLG